MTVRLCLLALNLGGDALNRFDRFDSFDLSFESVFTYFQNPFRQFMLSQDVLTTDCLRRRS